jgi:hypothetical protein
MNAGAQTKRSAVFHGLLAALAVTLYPGAEPDSAVGARGGAHFRRHQTQRPETLPIYREARREEYVPFFAHSVQALSRQTCSPAVGIGLAVTLVIILFRTFKVAHTVKESEYRGRKALHNQAL